MNIQMSQRLKVIASKVDKGSTVADIGTDHAYVPIYLVLNNICNNVIASDVRKGPVLIAERNVKKHNLSDKIKIRQGNGLETINEKDEIDALIIAGMGGVLLTEILTNSIKKLKEIKKLILQPMLGQEEVRLWLYNNNFTIIDEELVKEDGKFYCVIVAEIGTDILDDEIYLYIGKKLLQKKDPLIKEYLEKEIEKYSKIINNIDNEYSERANERLKVCNNHLNKLKLLHNNLDKEFEK